jgi:DNA polymerase IV
LARWSAGRTIDSIRNRCGRQAASYRSVALGPSRSVPYAFRELAKKKLRSEKCH